MAFQAVANRSHGMRGDDKAEVLIYYSFLFNTLITLKIKKLVASWLLYVNINIVVCNK